MIAARLAFLLGVLRGLLRPRPGRAPEEEQAEDVDPREHRTGADPPAERLVAMLLVAAGLLAAAFAVLIAVAPNTQLLGIALGGAFAALAAALILAAKRVAPLQIDVEQRHPPDPEAAARLVEDLRAGAEGISRRRMLAGAAGVAGAGLAGALLLPVTSLGPALGDAPDRTPWRRGRRLVDTEGRPLRAADIEIGTFRSALPEHEADALRELGAPVVVVRVDPHTLQLPPGRRGWAPGGILAFSQICTHAGCAVTLFRYPVSEETSKPPALVCPCHYSTFDVRRGAEPVFGPAVRALPQLPLAVGPDGVLMAAGPLEGSAGPSSLEVKQED